MTTIYDNPEFSPLGYSGVTYMEFTHEEMFFRITSGGTNNGGYRRVRAFTISVKTGSTWNETMTEGSVELFDMYAYEGGRLYEYLSRIPKKLQGPEIGQVADKIFGEALMAADNISALFRNAIQSSFRSGRVAGKREIRRGIKDMLDLE